MLLSALAPAAVQAQETSPGLPAGGEYLIVNDRTGRLLDADDRDGDIDRVDQSTGARNDDRWVLVAGGEDAPGSVRLLNAETGGLLAEVRDDNDVVTDARPNTPNSVDWVLMPRPDGTFVVTNTGTGRSLDADGPSSRYDVDTSFNIDGANNDARWRFLRLDPEFEQLDGATVLFSNLATRRWLDVDRGTVGMANVDQSIVSSTDDRWVLERLHNENWLIRNDETGGWLAASDLPPHNAFTVESRDDASEWSFVRDERDKWSVIHASTGRALDADYGRFNVDTSSNLRDRDAQWLIAAIAPLAEPAIDVDLVVTGVDSFQSGDIRPFTVTITNRGSVDLVDSAARDLRLTVGALHVGDALVEDVPTIPAGGSTDVTVDITGFAQTTRDLIANLTRTVDGTETVLASATKPVEIRDLTAGVVDIRLAAPEIIFVGDPVVLNAEIASFVDVPVLDNAELFVEISGDNVTATRPGPIPTLAPLATATVDIVAIFGIVGNNEVTAELIAVAPDGVDAVTISRAIFVIEVTPDMPGVN